MGWAVHWGDIKWFVTCAARLGSVLFTRLCIETFFWTNSTVLQEANEGVTASE